MGTISRTMKTKKRKKTSDPLFDFFQHPLSPFQHLTFVRLTIVFLGVLLGFVGIKCAAGTFGPAPSGAQSSSSSRMHAHDFVLFATVFTDKGFTLYGARIRLRREEEKKFRWEAMSDHQGEFAFRVPQGAEYEMTVEAKGFKTQTVKVDATEDTRTDLTVHMEPLAASGPEGKP